MTTEKQDKELPISLEELQQKKGRINSLSVEIWTTIEITPEVWEILWCYREDLLLARNVEILWHNLFKIEFVFPTYNMIKWELNEENNHVSIIQMQLAIVQWLFTAIGMTIKQNWISSPMSYETYLLNRGNVLYRRDQRTMRKKLKFNEKSSLIFKVNPIIKKWWTIYSIMIDLIKDKDSFLDGRVECVMQDEYLFDEREKAKFKDIKKEEKADLINMVGNVLTRFEANKDIKKTISMTDEINEIENT